MRGSTNKSPIKLNMNREDALTAKGLMGKQKKEENAELQGKKRDRKDNLSEAKARKSGLEAHLY